MNLTVSPAALGDASGAVRAACDDGTVLLARAVVRDLLDGAGDDGSTGFGVALPQLVEQIRERCDAIAAQLGSSADCYAHADRLPPVVRR